MSNQPISSPSPTYAATSTKITNDAQEDPQTQDAFAADGTDRQTVPNGAKCWIK
ncbi:MAG: hypothetical protein ACJAXQ_000645 [Parvibaculaceae bacterium]|jgi:hypothetical protein